MRKHLRLIVVGSILAATTLISGCIVVPVGGGHRHCGYYHCW